MDRSYDVLRKYDTNVEWIERLASIWGWLAQVGVKNEQRTLKATIFVILIVAVSGCSETNSDRNPSGSSSSMTIGLGQEKNSSGSGSFIGSKSNAPDSSVNGGVDVSPETQSTSTSATRPSHYESRYTQVISWLQFWGQNKTISVLRAGKESWGPLKRNDFLNERAMWSQLSLPMTEVGASESEVQAVAEILSLATAPDQLRSIDDIYTEIERRHSWASNATPQ